MQASDEFEMNEWLILINYASAFKTAGVRMRGSGMNNGQAVMAGAAAAASHKREVQGESSQTVLPTPAGTRKTAIFGTGDSGISFELPAIPIRVESVKTPLVDIDGANDVAVNEGEQLEEVFDTVKAELAAGRGGARKTSVPTREDRAGGSVPISSAHASRSKTIQVRGSGMGRSLC
jgi:hypothetical protein